MSGMKGRVKRIAILIAIVAALAGCAGPGNDPAGKSGKLPGKFSATALSDSFGGQARGVSLGNYTVSNSKSIYFILRNVGDFPITDVELIPGKLLANGGTFAPITDNGVTASPGTISVLETSGNTTVETIIEVDINHGNVVGLISQQYIQKADFAGATIRITGKTTDEDNAVVNVSLDVDIGASIKVASFEFQCSTDGVTWQTVNYDWSSQIGGLCYVIPGASKNYVKILNTGNVPLKYKAGILNLGRPWEDDNEWKDLNSGERSENLSLSQEKAFIVDTIGVAFDANDNEYFSFRANTSIVIDSSRNLIQWSVIN